MKFHELSSICDFLEVGQSAIGRIGERIVFLTSNDDSLLTMTYRVGSRVFRIALSIKQMPIQLQLQIQIQSFKLKRKF